MGIYKTSRKKRSRRAVSPVIATVILVAIAITIAVAVAYWMGGIAGQYTRFEQVEVQSAVCTKDVSNPSQIFWNISMTLKNTGTRDVTLINMFINEVEVDEYGVTSYDGSEDNWATSMSATEYVTSGNSTTIFIYIDTDAATLTSGTTINVKIHSSGGMDYPKLVELT